MTKVIDEYFKKVCTRDDIVSPMYYLSVLCITQSVWNTGYDCMLGYVYCEYLEFVLFIVLFVLFCTECSPCIVYLLLCTVYCPVYLYSVLCALSSVLSALYYVLCTAPCNMNYDHCLNAHVCYDAQTYWHKSRTLFSSVCIAVTAVTVLAHVYVYCTCTVTQWLIL